MKIKKRAAALALAAFMLPINVFAENYKYILPMEYERVEIDRTFKRIAALKNGKWAIYDLEGNKLSKDYDIIESFNREGVALVKNGGISTLIDIYGSEFPFATNTKEYGVVMGPTDGMIGIDISGNNDGRPPKYYEGSFALYDYYGNKITELPYEKYMPRYGTGYSRGFENGMMLFSEDGKIGAVDTNFEICVPAVYNQMYGFDENGFSIACKDGKFGIVDKQGNVILDIEYDDVLRVSGDFFRFSKDGKYGVVSNKGEVLFDGIEQEPWLVYDNGKVIKVVVENLEQDGEYSYLCGAVDETGNLIIPTEQKDILGASENRITVENKNGEKGYFDYTGKEITGFKYNFATSFFGGVAYVTEKNEEEYSDFLISSDGEVLSSVGGTSYGIWSGIAKTEDNGIVDIFGNKTVENPGWREVNMPTWYNNSGDDDKIIKVLSNEGNCGVIAYTREEPSKWAIEGLAKAGSEGLFPEELRENYRHNISREEFATLGAALLDKKGIERKENAENNFSDTDDENIIFLSSYGILKGKTENEFMPKDSITREEAATILDRIAKVLNIENNKNEYTEFSDMGDVSEWATEGVINMSSLGIMNGTGWNLFSPLGYYTKEQAVVTMLRLYESE